MQLNESYLEICTTIRNKVKTGRWFMRFLKSISVGEGISLPRYPLVLHSHARIKWRRNIPWIHTITIIKFAAMQDTLRSQ